MRVEFSGGRAGELPGLARAAPDRDPDRCRTNGRMLMSQPFGDAVCRVRRRGVGSSPQRVDLRLLVVRAECNRQLASSGDPAEGFQPAQAAAVLWTAGAQDLGCGAQSGWR